MAGKPKPTALKVLEGNPGKRPLPENEPKPKPIAPACPPWLNKDAKQMWKYLAPRLERLGLLTEIDGAAFTAACQEWGIWVELEKQLKRDGRTYTYTNKAGEPNLVERPESKIARNALIAFKSFCTEFGLTPASRVRLCGPARDAGEDEMERLLTKAGM